VCAKGGLRYQGEKLRDDAMNEERAAQQVLAKYVRSVDSRDAAVVAALFSQTARVEIAYNNSGTYDGRIRKTWAC
jgi:hypothetical protein